MQTNKRQLKFMMPIAALITTAMLCVGCKPKTAGMQFDSAAVSTGNIEQHVTASGTLSAVVSVDVGSQVSGKISELNVDFNSPVKKGQVLAEIDATVYNANLTQAAGNLANAKATVILKRQNLERKKILAPQGAASQLDLDQATAELAQAEAAVSIQEAALASAKANLAYCRITSPVDGIVIARKVDIGQTLAAAMTTPVLFTIAQNITKMHISAAVSEADIGQVKKGQSVTFNVDAFPDQVFNGTVVQVRKAPTTTSNVVTYETIIDVDNPEQKLFPGMTADVSILVTQKPNILKISNAALRFTPPDHTAFATPPPTKLERNQRLAYTTSKDGKLQPVVVRVGVSDGVDTEILDGINAGTPLVTSTLTPGAKRGGPGGPPP